MGWEPGDTKFIEKYLMSTYYVMLCSGSWKIKNNSDKTLALKKLMLWSVSGQGVRALNQEKKQDTSSPLGGDKECEGNKCCALREGDAMQEQDLSSAVVMAAVVCPAHFSPTAWNGGTGPGGWKVLPWSMGRNP